MANKVHYIPDPCGRILAKYYQRAYFIDQITCKLCRKKYYKRIDKESYTTAINNEWLNSRVKKA